MHPRSGRTAMELLLATAVVASLVGLALPVVQQARRGAAQIEANHQAENARIEAQFAGRETASPNRAAGTRNFALSDRIAFTYFFTWYNAPGSNIPPNPQQDHILHPQGFDYLSVHPAPQTVSFDRNPNFRARRPPNVSGAPLMSYGNPAWFEQELSQMHACGIDICAVDFWAFPDANAPPRSRLAVERMDQAMAAMDAARRPYPAVCLFLESKPMGNGQGGGGQVTDLGTEEGARKLFRAVDDFYSRVARHRWASIGGRVPVILYDADFPGFIARPFGINRCKQMFRDKYGVGLCFFGNNEWRAASRAGSAIDYHCHWGAAVRPDRLIENTDLMEISPGTLFLGSSRNVPRSLEGYRAAWERARRQPRNWIAIETWNEWHEGTGVARTLEDGRSFFEVTQAQIRRFKQRQ